MVAPFKIFTGHVITYVQTNLILQYLEKRLTAKSNTLQQLMRAATNFQASRL